MSCVNCQAVTTNDGRTVWVCERCGQQNDTVPTPDVTAAQAAISAAAAQAEPIISVEPAVSAPTAAAAAPQIDQMVVPPPAQPAEASVDLSGTATTPGITHYPTTPAPIDDPLAPPQATTAVNS